MTTSTLRTALRTRLTRALRERDRATASVVWSAIAAIENAEAVPVAERAPIPAGEVTSEHVAAAATGLGAAEAPRVQLTPDDEERIVRAEVDALGEAASAYEAAGQRDRAADARRGADSLSQVVHSVLGKSWG